MFQSIGEIVHRSISQISCYHNITKTDEYLVLMTWLMESGLGESYHPGNPDKHGYMMLTKDQFRVILFDHIRVRQGMCDDIKRICMIDIREHKLDELFDALSYNVAFQAIVTWCFYHSQLNEMPRDIESVAHTYFDRWKRQSIVDSEDVEDAIAMLIEWTNEMGV